MAFNEGTIVEVLKADRVTVNYVGKITKLINEPSARVRNLSNGDMDMVPQTLLREKETVTVILPVDWEIHFDPIDIETIRSWIVP